MKLLAMILTPAAMAVHAYELNVVCSAVFPETACIAQDDAPQEMARGTVTKIDSADKSFTLRTAGEGSNETIVRWNDATVFMIDGKVKKWDEVVVENARLTVAHKRGMATKVEGFTDPS